MRGRQDRSGNNDSFAMDVRQVGGAGAADERTLLRDTFEDAYATQDSFTTFAHCGVLFARTACRVAAGAGAGVGAVYAAEALGALTEVSLPVAGAAAAIGALGALAARGCDDLSNSCKDIDRYQRLHTGKARLGASVCMPCLPSP